MPGPFTIILKKKDIIPANVSANLDTVGIRMPDNKIAYELIKKAAVPVHTIMSERKIYFYRHFLNIMA